MQRSKAIKHSPSFWEKHLKAWYNSGLSQAEYCRRNNIRVKAFGYHKACKFGSKKECKNEKVLDLVALPTPIQQLQNTDSFADSGISISLGSKASINVYRSCDRKCLADILGIVSDL
jgi:hypothetical protein